MDNNMMEVPELPQEEEKGEDSRPHLLSSGNEIQEVLPVVNNNMADDSDEIPLVKKEAKEKLNLETSAAMGMLLSAPSGSGTMTNNKKVSNEYVLNFAFFSFLVFTIVQFFAAIAANSKSMLADSYAMAVDAVTYLMNSAAERYKNKTMSMADHWTPRQMELRYLYLELVPPFFSVVALLAFTVDALKIAIESVIAGDLVHSADEPANDPDLRDSDDPNVTIMFIFSSINLLLDIINVTCFARLRAMGLHNATTTTTCSSQPGVPQQQQQGNAREGTMYTRLSRATHAAEALAAQGPCSPGHIREDTFPLDEEDPSGSDQDRPVDDGEAGTPPLRKRLGFNLNMCAALTHICADTLRSLAVLLAATVTTLFPSAISPSAADSWATIAVCTIVLVSLVPLVRGLVITFLKIWQLWSSPADSSSPTKKNSTTPSNEAATVDDGPTLPVVENEEVKPA